MGGEGRLKREKRIEGYAYIISVWKEMRDKM